jgi:hypothetical protein
MKLKEQVNTTHFLAAAEPSADFLRAIRDWLSTASLRKVKLFPIDGKFH